MTGKDYIGKKLDDRYELLDLIGTGGMAYVFKARDHRLGRYVAVKILKDEYRNDEEFLIRFRTESRAVAMLSHPNIVAVYDVSSTAGAEYMVMELLDGIDLKSYINRKGLLTWKETLHFTIQIAKALKHAHSKGIIHRDIKPQNIMVLKDATVKVADFGIARLMSSSHESSGNDNYGSAHYISPEQVRGGRIDARTDIYSLGVVMYEMLTSTLPFDGESDLEIAMRRIDSPPTAPRDLNPEVPLGLQDITLGAMESDIKLRYQSADSLMRELEEFRHDPTTRFLSEQISADGTVSLVPAGERRIMVQRKRGESRKPEMSREEYRESKRRAGVTALALGSGIVIIVLVLLTIFLWDGYIRDWFNPPSPITVEIPDLSGKLLTVVSNTAVYTDDFEFVEYGTEYSPDYPEYGYIIRQNPDAFATQIKPEGEKIKIKVWVSGGKPSYDVMPDVTGKLESTGHNEIQRFAKDRGIVLDIEVKTETSTTVEKDCIISTNPAAGDPVYDGNKILLVVSAGPEIKEFSMPSLVGRQLSEARSIIEEHSLVLEASGVTEVEDESTAGTVLWQSLTAGTTVKEGERVALRVSKGPPPIKMIIMPKITDGTLDDAKLRLSQFNLSLGGYTEEENEAPAGTVIWQSVTAGTEVAEETVIDIRISLGPPPSPSPIELPSPTPYPVTPDSDFPNDEAMQVGGEESGTGESPVP